MRGGLAEGNRISISYFFDFVIKRYVMHFLARIYVVFTLFGCALLRIDSVQGGIARSNKFLGKLPSLFLGVKKYESFGFFLNLSQKCVSESRIFGVCMGRSGTSAYTVYAFFSHFCYVCGFGDFRHPVLSTPRGVSGDVVTVYTYQDKKGRFFLQSIALPRAGQNPCQTRKMTVSTNNGLHE